jgi:digeranylgeranylglycerophospholipid reductase
MSVKEFDYDIVVVGGGPAGSSAAFAAAKNGVKVALLEKEKCIAQSVRTSGVTWLRDVEKFEIPPDCYNKIRNYSFYSPNNQVSMSDSEPRAVVLDVRKTYQWLAQQAAKKGADIFVMTTVNGIITNEQGKISGVKAFSVDDCVFNAKIVIDASGFQSVVAKSMGIVTQWERFGAGAEYEAYAEHFDSETWWLMVGQQYSPAGYAWIFPVNKKIVRIGVGVGKPESSVDPTERLKQLLETKPGPIKNLGKITPIEFHYGLIPNDGLSRKTVYDNLILVGDSAGQANPLVLEGIRYAIMFGRVAGEVAANAIKSGDTSEKSLKKYEENWKKSIQSKINSASKVQNRWIGLSDEEWDKEIEIIKELTPDEFIDFIKADFGLANIVRLASHHPKMIVRQLFDIVRGTKSKEKKSK